MFIWPDGRPGAVQRAGRERPLPSTQPSPACCGFMNRLRISPAMVSEAAEVRRFVDIVSSSLPPADSPARRRQPHGPQTSMRRCPLDLSGWQIKDIINTLRSSHRAAPINALVHRNSFGL